MIKHPLYSALNSHSKVLYNPVNPDGCVLALTKPYIGSDKWIDYSGYGNDGTIHGATKNSDGFLSFNGEDAYVDCGNNSCLDITKAFAIKFLLKTTATTCSIIFKGGVGSSTNYGADLQNGVLRIFGYDSNGDYHGIISGTGYAINDNRLYYITESFDGTNWIIYVNGDIYDSIIDATTLNPTSQSLQIGARQETGFCEGLLAEFQIFRRSLSQQEATQYTYPY